MSGLAQRINHETKTVTYGPPRDIGEHIAFRGPLSEDLPFIFDSWLKSQWNADAKAKLEADVFFPAQRERIRNILGRASVVLAFSPAAPDEALGYVVHETIMRGAVVHWCYVKQPYRRLGIAKCLLRIAQGAGPANMSHTHKGDARGKRLLSRFRSVFNPYL